MTTATQDIAGDRDPRTADQNMRHRIGRMSQADARMALEVAINDLERQIAARIEAEEQRDSALAQLRELEEAALRAGGIGIVQERRDNRLILTLGRSDVVVGIADASVDYRVGDRVRTDLGRAVAVENLGGGDERARDVAQLVSTHDGSRAVVKINGRERVFTLAHSLQNGQRDLLRPGAVLIVDEEAGIIYAVFSAPEAQDYTEAIPEVVFVSNPHLEALENRIIKPLWAGPEKRKAGACFIIAGPAGGGKTHLVLSACRRHGVKMIRVTGDTVSSGIVGETGKAIAQIFERAIEQGRKNVPTIVAIEEANVLVSRRYGYDHRSAASQEFANISSSVIVALDELTHLGPELPVEVILTTNAPSEIEPAVRSRSTEHRIGFIDRAFGAGVMRAHMQSRSVRLAGGEEDLERLVHVLFDLSTPMVRVDAEAGQTRERFSLFPGQLMLPRLISSLVGDLTALDQPVAWQDAVGAAHGRLLSHAAQVADSPEHYVAYCDHPFSGDADVRIRRAVPVYPAAIPHDLLF